MYKLTAKQKELRDLIDRTRSKKGKPTAMEKAYESALAVARAFTDLSPQDDPEHPNFVDPLDRPQPIIGPLDLCELCFEPHQADRPDKTLMQCCFVFSAPCGNGLLMCKSP